METEYVKHVDEGNFEALVMKGERPVLVDFWAPWCGPCRMIGPMIEELAKDYADRIDVAKINIDESPKIAATFGIRSIPTLIFVKDGKVAEKVVGAAPKDQMAALIERNLQ